MQKPASVGALTGNIGKLTVRKHITSASRIQRTIPVKPKQLVSARLGNEGATARDFARNLSTGLRLACFNGVDDVFTLCIAPGEGFGRQARREIEQEVRRVDRPNVFPNTAEFEFSTSPFTVFKAASGLPEGYRTSVIDWAIELSRAVVIYVDTSPGTPAGEPYRILAPIQAGFRCSEAQVEVWVDYLGRRVRPRHRFAVVRFAPCEVRS